MKKVTVIILAPSIEPHDDPRRVIGRRTRYRGEEHRYLRGHEETDVDVLTFRNDIFADRGTSAKAHSLRNDPC